MSILLLMQTKSVHPRLQLAIKRVARYRRLLEQSKSRKQRKKWQSRVKRHQRLVDRLSPQLGGRVQQVKLAPDFIVANLHEAVDALQWIGLLPEGKDYGDPLLYLNQRCTMQSVMDYLRGPSCASPHDLVVGGREACSFVKLGSNSLHPMSEVYAAANFIWASGLMTSDPPNLRRADELLANAACAIGRAATPYGLSWETKIAWLRCSYQQDNPNFFLQEEKDHAQRCYEEAAEKSSAAGSENVSSRRLNEPSDN
jgi:hypothetical protein